MKSPREKNILVLVSKNSVDIRLNRYNTMFLHNMRTDFYILSENSEIYPFNQENFTTALEMELKDIEIKVILTKDLSVDDLGKIHQLFDQSYDQANYLYLEKSFARLRYISLAIFKDELVGFGVADAVETKLPRLTELQVVLMGGICCVASDYRRLGLFKHLQDIAFRHSDQMRPAARYLACGRMAHPASFRLISKTSAVIPKFGVPLSDWQKEISQKVAELYGINLDPDSLVAVGDGSPCGYPKFS